MYSKLTNSLCASEAEVEAVYAQLLKTNKESRHVNCRACGFSTCEQMAVAIFTDMRTKTSCALYPKY